MVIVEKNRHAGSKRHGTFTFDVCAEKVDILRIASQRAVKLLGLVLSNLYIQLIMHKKNKVGEI